MYMLCMQCCNYQKKGQMQLVKPSLLRLATSRSFSNFATYFPTMLSNRCSRRRCYLAARSQALFFNWQRISRSLSNTFHSLSSRYSCSLPLLTFSWDSRHSLAALSALSFVGALGACGGRQLLRVDATCGLATFSPMMRSSRDLFLVLFYLSALPIELRLPSSTDCLFRSLAPSPRAGFTFSFIILSQRVSRPYSDVKELLGIGREGDGASRRALRQKEKSFLDAERDLDIDWEAETGRLGLEPERGCGWTVHLRGSISSQLFRILRAFWTALSCDIITTIINILIQLICRREGRKSEPSLKDWWEQL